MSGKVRDWLGAPSGSEHRHGALTVRLVETLGERVVPSRFRVAVHELARVIGVIPRLLQPNGEIIVVEPLLDKLRITSYFLEIN